ncbi:helix-turn-helix domain-containing protein [Desulfolithobacter sp.]
MEAVKLSNTEILDQIREVVIEAIQAGMLDKGVQQQFFTEGEAAELLRVKPQTLSVWRHEGRGPAYRKHGSRVVYSRDDLEEFSRRQTVRTAQR